ncbi:MAG: indolepyruvate oxidoreductase subunit beta [Clostridiales bacterium]|jgi:indolepyruvate ferredoxin oxidoreductase beta subunit|nr:indolepyruvate oxidoreductase subunit beta [Clostridiales bacterium]
MNKSIILCGVGGQGTIMASRLIAAAAMEKGLDVRSAETIGMAQRGGSVFSHIRLGKDINSPLIAKGEADLIIGFEPAEVVRMLPYLRCGGAAIVSLRPVMPVSAAIGKSVYPYDEIMDFLKSTVKRLTLVDSEAAAAQLDSSRVLNVVLLGAAARSGELGIDEDALLSAIDKIIPEKFRQLNREALYYTKQR